MILKAGVLPGGGGRGVGGYYVLRSFSFDLLLSFIVEINTYLEIRINKVVY